MKGSWEMNQLVVYLIAVALQIVMVGGQAATSSPQTPSPVATTAVPLFPQSTVAPITSTQSPMLFNTSGGDSPVYGDVNPFTNAQAASLVASILSGLCGSPMTACHVWRSSALLSACRQPLTSTPSSSQVPFPVAIGRNVVTRYYAGTAMLFPVEFLAFASFTALCSLVFTKSKGASWRKTLVVGRYPQHLLFPFFCFFQTGVTSSVAVVVLDDDVTRRVVSGLMISFWMVVYLVPCIYLIKTVPFRAQFVRKYRDVSDEATIEKELYRRISELEEQNNKREAEAKRQLELETQERQRIKAAQDRRDEIGTTVTTATAFEIANGIDKAQSAVVKYAGEPGTREYDEAQQSSVGGGVASWFAAGDSKFSFRSAFMKALGSIIPDDQEEELVKHTDMYVEAASKADDAEKERLRQVTNLVYSKMLASQIQMTSFDDTAVQQTLTGTDRWEDKKPLNGEEDNEVNEMSKEEEAEVDNVLSMRQQAALADYVPAPLAAYLAGDTAGGAKSRTGFLRMWGGLFRHYKEDTYWFLVVECTVSLIVGVMDGWKPFDGNGSSCFGQSSVLLAVFGLYFALLVVFRPHLVPLDAGLVLLTALLLLVGSALLVVAVAQQVAWAVLGVNVLAVCCIYLYVLRSLLDVYIVVAPLFFSKEVSWPTSALTQYYFDVQRQTSDSTFFERRRAEMDEMEKNSSFRKSRNSDSSSTKSPSRRSRAGSFSSSGGDNATSAAGEQTTSNKTGTPEKGSRESPTRENNYGLDVRAVDAIENEAVRYRGIGGRRNGYVTSRGVPEGLHPFALCPLPKYPLLEPRDPSTLEWRLQLIATHQGDVTKVGSMTGAKLFEALSGVKNVSFSNEATQHLPADGAAPAANKESNVVPDTKVANESVLKAGHPWAEAVRFLQDEVSESKSKLFTTPQLHTKDLKNASMSSAPSLSSRGLGSVSGGRGADNESIAIRTRLGTAATDRRSVAADEYRGLLNADPDVIATAVLVNPNSRALWREQALDEERRRRELEAKLATMDVDDPYVMKQEEVLLLASSGAGTHQHVRLSDTGPTHPERTREALSQRAVALLQQSVRGILDEQSDLLQQEQWRKEKEREEFELAQRQQQRAETAAMLRQRQRYAALEQHASYEGSPSRRGSRGMWDTILGTSTGGSHANVEGSRDSPIPSSPISPRRVQFSLGSQQRQPSSPLMSTQFSSNVFGRFSPDSLEL